jgi:hypothetical protein
MVFAASAFAQEDKALSLADNGKLAKYGYYMMQEDYLIHYLPEGKADTMKTNVSLRNGKILTSIGELLDRDGSRIFLKVGECVNVNGNIDACHKLQLKMEKKTEKKK